VNGLRPYGAPPLMNADMASTEHVVATLRPTVGNIRLGPINKAYAVPLRVPVLRNGKLKYILTAAIKPEVFARLIEGQQLPPTWVNGLVDGTGHFIARTPPRSPAEMASNVFLAAVAGNKEGWYRGLTVEGKDAFTAYVTSDLSGWSAGFAIPAEDVTAPAAHAAWGMAIGAVVTVIIVLGFAYWMGRRIATPIAELAAAARALGERREPTPLAT